MIGICGLMALVFFDDGGQIPQVRRFAAVGAIADPTIAAGTKSPPGFGIAWFLLSRFLFCLKLRRVPTNLAHKGIRRHGPRRRGLKKEKPTWPIYMH